jgi:hypothetical protein
MSSDSDITRYLNLAAHDLLVLRALRSGALAIKGPADVSDWTVTLTFYSACILMKALARSRNRDLQDHYSVKQWMNTTADLLPVAKAYRKLEERSRDARYEGATFDDRSVKQSVEWFESVRDHVVALLAKAGVREIPRLDARAAIGL